MTFLLCAPAGVLWAWEGLPCLHRSRATRCCASSQLLPQEEDQMRHATLSMMCVVAMLGLGLTASVALADDRRANNATVSFGEWQTEPPLDRFPINSPRERNEHRLIPRTVTIKAGGSVNFIISGFHQPAVYDDGTRPRDIDETLTVGSTGVPPNVPLINDPDNRIYRGLDPSRLHLVDPIVSNPSIVAQDRVEVVVFPKPGKYLVICAVQPHFVNDNMYGFVVVRGEEEEEEAD
jgi:plastocyanin